MKQWHNKMLWWAVWLLFLPALAAGLWYGVFDLRRQDYFRQVQANLTRATSQMLEESDRLRLKILSQDTLLFATCLQPAAHSYFVFEDRELLYWSDFRFVPEYENLSGNYQFRFLNLKTGKYLAHKRTFAYHHHSIEIFSLLKLEKRYEIDNQYLSSGLNTALIPASYGVTLSDDASDPLRNLFAADGTFVASLLLTAPLPYHPVSYPILFGFCLLLVLAGVVYNQIQYFKKRRAYEWAMLLLLGYLLLLRWYMVEFNLPYNLIETDLFDSKFYASSVLNQSLGDLLLNIIAGGLCAWFLMRYFFQSALGAALLRQPQVIRAAVAVLAVVSGYVLAYLPFLLFRNVYLHSQIQVDISRSLDFTGLRVMVFLCFALVAVTYFLLMHLFAYLLLTCFPEPEKLFVVWISGTLLFVLGSLVLQELDYNLLLITALSFGVLLFFRLPATLYRFRYTTSLYFFWGAMVCAMLGAYTVFSLEQRRQNQAKTDYGLQGLAENDYEAEFLLQEAVTSISNDNFIKVKLNGLLPSTDLVEQKIRRGHLQPYFSKYNVNVLLFNEKGASLKSGEEETYYNFVTNFYKDKYKTDYPDVFFAREYVRNGNVVKEYVAFAKIMDDSMHLGYVVVDLKQKKTSSDNVYPELLIDKNAVELPENREYSYAVFRNNKLEYESGSFGYLNNFPKSLLQNPQLLTKGIIVGDFHHLLVRGSNYKRDLQQIVVTSPRYPLRYQFANFSFLFLILVLVALGVIVCFGVFGTKPQESGNFSTKIQLYLNAAFFLPLLLVSIITLTRISAANRETLANQYLTKARSVSENIAASLDRFYEGDIPKDTLADQLLQLARYSQADINLFDKSGSLILSDQPRIFEKNILSSFINPDALLEISEKNNREVMLEESVGSLRYNSVYVGVKGFNSERLGIVSIPFFAAQAESDRQIIELLATMMNIFTGLFIIFLLLSYFASRVLTIPLQLIARKLKGISLSTYNEPLQWRSDDEIGLLVNEYNKMLVNLEANKKALAQSEKESAWREMAQQVAHEIKNPLTPMKLTLQHLQRTLPNGKTPQLERSLATLLEQVDTLNEIAGSFSSFAKMPVPKEEVFDLAEVLQQTADLYHSNQNVLIITDIPPQPCFVKADDQLMSRIFTNLILNGIQSVPSSRIPELTLSLRIEAGFALIEIRDNGAGIPEGVQKNIFVPNFSTKYSGSGIGLAVAKRGVEHAGGSIWFETKIEEGTSFFISLPVAG